MAPREVELGVVCRVCVRVSNQGVVPALYPCPEGAGWSARRRFLLTGCWRGIQAMACLILHPLQGWTQGLSFVHNPAGQSVLNL